MNLKDKLVEVIRIGLGLKNNMASKIENRLTFFNSFLSKSPLKIDGRIFNFACPCCGYPALSVRAGVDFCFVCNWEDSEDFGKNLDIPSSPNFGLTLRVARTNFEKFFVIKKLDLDKFKTIRDKIRTEYDLLEKTPSELANIQKRLSGYYKEYKQLLQKAK